MSGGFTFVHAADLHLDSQFKGLEQCFLNGESVPGSILTRLRNCTFESFGRIIDLCIERKVDFLLLAGDIYDVADKSLRAQIRFRDELTRLAGAGIPAFVVHGNHDHLGGWRADLKFPDTVHIFNGRGVEARPVMRDGREIARVYGLSYPRQAVFENYAALFDREPDAPFAIALLHCNVGGAGGHENYSPCKLNDLLGKGFDYWALGHVHSRVVLNPAGPCVAYPGCSQGRSAREAGGKGCFFVSVEDTGGVDLEFVPVSTVRWENVEVSIDGLQDDQELLDKLEESLLALQAVSGAYQVVARILLTGRGALHKNLVRPSYAETLAQALRSRFTAEGEGKVFLESIRTGTGASVDRGELARSGSLLGDLLSLADKALDDRQLRAELLSSLDTLIRHPRAARYPVTPGEKEFNALLEMAGNMAVDLLWEGDD